MTLSLERPPPAGATFSDAPAVRAPERTRRRRRTAGGRTRVLWWVTPAGSLALVVPLSLFVSVAISDRDYRLFFRVPKAITSNEAQQFLLAAAILAVGTVLPLVSGRGLSSRREWPGLSRRQLQILNSSASVCFWLTVTGYVLFAAVGAARGATPTLLIHALTSQSNYSGSLKTIFAPIAGVTSLTQVGIAYVVTAAVLRTHNAGHHTGRRLWIVVLLGLMRSYFLTERLAILELLVPLVAIIAYHHRQTGRTARLLPALPVIALPMLIVVFGAFEYSRSWQYFKSRTTLSFPAFVVRRLAGYYATSYNNGALQLQFGDRSGRLPYDSIQGIWTSPGPAQLDLYHRLTGANGQDVLNTVLAQHGTPEFNNPGGLAVPLFDFGTTGGLVYFFVFGIVIGYAYRSFRAGNPVGLLIYPVLFTGLLELPRYVYWTEGRVVPAYLALLVIAALMSRNPWRRRRRAGLGSGR